MDHGNYINHDQIGHVFEGTTTDMGNSQPHASHGEHVFHGEHATDSVGMMEHMVSMSFHFGTTEMVLFDSWKFDSVGGLIGSMTGIFFMSALYEGIKYYREYLLWKTYQAYRSVTCPTKTDVVNQDNQVAQPKMMSCMHYVQTVLHIIQMTLSYFLMLIFMTYNVWLCIAVVVGAAVGYFLSGWKKSVTINVAEHFG